MKKKPKQPIINVIEQLLVICAKGFVGCLCIGFPLELIGIDLLADTTIYTHFYEYLGVILVVGLPLHFFIWKVGNTYIKS